jgi:hypothetical protein
MKDISQRNSSAYQDGDEDETEGTTEWQSPYEQP